MIRKYLKLSTFFLFAKMPVAQGFSVLWLSGKVSEYSSSDMNYEQSALRLYESALQMKLKDVRSYRKLSECGDIVFAGIYS